MPKPCSASQSPVKDCFVMFVHCCTCRYAVQYEDGDTEELLASELKKEKRLQRAGPQDRTDYDELDRLYAAAKVQWAKGAPTHKDNFFCDDLQ